MPTILEHLDRGTLVRGDWGDGHERACLYSALVPDATSTENCPAHIMPQWLADVTPALDDYVSKAGWKARMRRYGEASLKWHVISPDAWEHIHRNWRADCIELALTAADQLDHEGDYWPKVQAACAAIVLELRAGREPSKDNLAEAGEAARAAASAAWAAWAARAAARAAEAAASAAWAVRAAARAAAEAAAWDTMFDALMSRIEGAIEQKGSE